MENYDRVHDYASKLFNQFVRINWTLSISEHCASAKLSHYTDTRANIN